MPKGRSTLGEHQLYSLKPFVVVLKFVLKQKSKHAFFVKILNAGSFAFNVSCDCKRSAPSLVTPKSTPICKYSVFENFLADFYFLSRPTTAVGDGMFLGMQDFDFAQIWSLLSKFCIDFA